MAASRTREPPSKLRAAFFPTPVQDRACFGTSTRARQAQMFRRKFEDVDTWMRMRRLPKFTQKKVCSSITVALTQKMIRQFATTSSSIADAAEEYVTIRAYRSAEHTLQLASIPVRLLY